MQTTKAHNDAIALTKELIEKQSVTPADDGCQPLMAERLSKIGFNCESLPAEEVLNLWATRGNDGPLLVFAGHTDVVPPGPLEHWDDLSLLFSCIWLSSNLDRKIFKAFALFLC